MVFARFVAERPQALAGLRDRLAASGHDAAAMLDGSVDSLVRRLGAAVHPWSTLTGDAWGSEAEPFEGQLAPEWYRHGTREERLLSLDSVHLLAWVMSYVGEVVMGAVPGIAWRRGRGRVRTSTRTGRCLVVATRRWADDDIRPRHEASLRSGMALPLLVASVA